MIVPEQVIDDATAWPDPAYPVEHAEGGEEVPRYKVPQETADEGEEEESFSGDVALFGAPIGGM